MKGLIKDLYYKFDNLIKYGIIGCFTSSLDFIIYTFFIWIGTYYLIANVLSVTVGISTSFILNRKYNFKVPDHTLKRFIIFFSIGIFGLVLSSIILYICISMLNIDKLISKLSSIVLVVIMQFFLNKFITFKESKNKK